MVQKQHEEYCKLLKLTYLFVDHFVLKSQKPQRNKKEYSPDSVFSHTELNMEARPLGPRRSKS